jgi:hypothetical protein
LSSLILVVAFCALATGLPQYLHLREHAIEHERAAAAPGSHHDDHDDDGDRCELCVQLHMPAISAGWVPVLICTGLFVAFLTLLATRLAPQRVIVRLACRGPPVL